MISNIQGFSEVINNLKRKFELLEDRVNRLNIVGGDNIYVNRFGSDFIINGGAEGGTVAGEETVCPWKVIMKKEDPFDEEYPQWTLQTQGGMVNGLLPNNYDNIVSVNDAQDLYVYWEAVTNGAQIETLEIMTSTSVPDTQYVFQEDGLPSIAKGLVAFYFQGAIAYQYACAHMTMRPELGYSIDDPSGNSQVKNYYTWAINEV